MRKLSLLSIISVLSVIAVVMADVHKIPANRNQITTQNNLWPAVPWTPAQLDTVIWLDAQNSNSLSITGGLVTQWDDISVNASSYTQGNVGIQPTYQATGFNGLPCVDFTSGNKGMNGTFAPTNSGEWALFLIGFNATSSQFLQDILNFNDSSPSSPMRWGARTGTGAFEGILNGGGLLRFLSGSSSDKMMVFEHNATAGVLYRYRASQPVATTNGTWASYTPSLDGNVGLGSKYNTTGSGQQHYNGTMGELIFIQGPISTADRQRVEGYLAWRWNYVSMLPAGHPYKDAPPVIF